MKTEQTVLLVDDIPEYLDVMELNLPEGCRVVTAASAAEARKRIEKEAPTLAVVDVRLREDDAGNRDGLELLKWIRGRYPAIPVIMISAYREFEFEAESLVLGAEYFLKKPVQPDEFRNAVTKVLGNA
jgi:CheY-like chemotaxis protein